MNKVLFFLTCLIGGFLIGIYVSEEKVKKAEEKYFQEYNKYIELYIPAPFLEEQIEYPVKKRNPKLKEKFKG